MFNKDVSEELKEILSIELHRYKREIGHMTNEEWNLLADWVYSGHSPYSNGDNVFDDDGWPLDFISTLRSWKGMLEHAESLSKDTPKNPIDIPEEPGFVFPEGFFDTIDLPFD